MQTDGPAFPVAKGEFYSFKEVPRFISEKVRPQLTDDKITKDEPSALLFGQLLRVEGWLRTLVKLNEPSDFQGVAAACRALFETTIDMVLLYANPARSSQVLAWEESARFKRSQTVARYYESISCPPREDHQVHINVAKRDKEKIDQLRLRQGWSTDKGKPRHPMRWTARDLSDDAVEADSHGHDFQFRLFYQTVYQEVCWMVHGAGFAHRAIPSHVFPALGGLLYGPCADMGTLSAELVLRHMVGWDASQEKSFADLLVRRIIVSGMTMRLAEGKPPLPDEPPTE